MQKTVFLLIILIPLAGFLTERVLEYLNSRMWSDSLPGKLKGICSEDEYRKSQLYSRENKRLSVWSSSLNLAVMLAVIVFGGFAWIDSVIRNLSANNVVIALIFFGVIGFASDLLNIPFTWIDTFVIEKKFGFNTTTPRVFITDHLKGWLLALIIGAPVLGLITWFYYLTGKNFWIWAWLVISAFTIVMNLLYSEVIVPLFNKQVPLEEGELRNMIGAFAEKAGFRLKNIYVIDGSKRSTKANAYFSGFGPRKRIVLFDTLIKEFSSEEIVAVLAHEIGHYTKKHVLKSLVGSIAVTGIMLFLFSRIADNPYLSAALGSEKQGFHLGLVVFGILYSPLSLAIGLVMNSFSRKNEFEADRFVRENYKPERLAEALKKLSVMNLSNMNPHPAYVFFHYSHPPLLQRLEQLES
jgi:STE24 endopeptidase